MNKYLTLTQAAKVIGFSKQYAYKLYKDGKFIKPAIELDKYHGSLWSLRAVMKFKKSRDEKLNKDQEQVAC